MVRRLCDRRAGLGGDGVLRVVRSVHVPDAADVLGDDLGRCEWFMDHRNADGSHAEMCGNGIRLFLHVLVTEGLLDRAHVRGRRPGRHPRRPAPGRVPRRTATTGSTWARPGVRRRGGARWTGGSSPGRAVSMGNPHLAALTDVDVDALDLTGAPGVRRRRCSPTASTSS